ncbi:unnamed protein product [Lymnaea stagnalis]|uniref:Mirror-image polydactyly gene 1 protein n=1 Tax=Lymnaea stagnalis TaxID=6523 RepID=A0AAV2H1Q0_LYMST
MADEQIPNESNRTIFRRRLDRTPEKHFEKLPEKEKVAFSNLRKALEEAKFRIVRLRDENDEKDCIIDEERLLRKLAEDKLQNILVDLYNNPEVNSELRQRLPRANKSDPLHKATAAHQRNGDPFVENNFVSLPKGNQSLYLDKMLVENRAREDVNKSYPVALANEAEGHSEIDRYLATSDHELQTDSAYQGLQPGNRQTNRLSNEDTQSSQSILKSSVGITPSSSISPLVQVPTNALSSASFSSTDSSSYQPLPSFHQIGQPSLANGALSTANSSSNDYSRATIPQGTATLALQSLHKDPGTYTTHPSVGSVAIRDGQSSDGRLVSDQRPADTIFYSRQQPTEIRLTNGQPADRLLGDQAVPSNVHHHHNPVTDDVRFLTQHPRDFSNSTHPPTDPRAQPTDLRLAYNYPTDPIGSTRDRPSDPTNGQPQWSATVPSGAQMSYIPAYPLQYPNLPTLPSAAPHHYQYILSNNSTIPPAPSLPANSYSFPYYQSIVPVEGANPRSNQEGVVNVSHVSRLLAEIATLKKENQELRNQLKNAKQDIVLLQSDIKTGQEDSLNTVGALIADVHAAEKKRDEAVKRLVRSADKDKTAALGELDRIKLSNMSSHKRSLSESDISEAEQSSVSLPSQSRAEHSKDSTSTRVYLEQLVSRQREIMKEEMQRVIDQRNEARQKLLNLENKFSALQMSKASDTKLDTLMAKLKLTERERDLLLAKLQFLMRDIGETKLVYNLHKALLAEDPANAMTSYETNKTNKADVNTDLVNSDLLKNNLTAQVLKQADDKINFETKLKSLQKENLAQAEYIDKLQQLVHRQRHKLNTLCAGPMLMD